MNHAVCFFCVQEVILFVLDANRASESAGLLSEEEELLRQTLMYLTFDTSVALVYFVHVNMPTQIPGNIQNEKKRLSNPLSENE